MQNLISKLVEIEKKLQACLADLEKNKKDLISSLETSSETYESLFSICAESKKTLLQKLELQDKQTEDFKKKNKQIVKILKKTINSSLETQKITEKIFENPRDKVFFERNIQPYSTLRLI